jgi:molybdate transport system substrate-binding protein
MRPFRILILALLVLASPAAALAAEVRVMISAGFTAAFETLVPQYERATGDRVVAVQSPSMGNAPTSMPNRLARGEPADVLILVDDAMDGLIAQGWAEAASRTRLADSRIGLSVRAGAAKPDISTVDALRRTLLQAKSIAYSDSASGTYIEREMFAKLGIADQVRPKSRMIVAEPVAAVVARGDAEIGFQQISALRPVAGAQFVGPIPEPLQKVTIFSAAVAKGARQPERARALIAFLASPAARPAIVASGLDPSSMQP